jgi:uncharacterized membrane protein YraQ (UPF0718 family)
MNVLLGLCFVALVLSALADRRKTVAGLRKALAMFFNILPSLLAVLVLVAVFTWLVPPERMRALFGGESKALGMATAAIIGSIALIPGFVAYPLCGVLIRNGVSYDVVAVFITTLMMVGVLTLPLEAHYFGMRTAVLRNTLSFVGALVVGVLMAVVL